MSDYSGAVSQKRLAALAGGKLFHAYIFEGGRGTDKLRAAETFAKTVHCLGEAPKPCGICLSCVKAEHGNHEDILYLTRNGNSIGVKQIEELQIRLRGKPFASDRIIAVVDEAERMTPQSQNKLLKTLEEPSGGNIIILLTSNSALLLKTIQSRCVVLRLGAAGAAPSGEFAELAAEFYAKIAAGGAYYELYRLVGAAAERDASGDFLDILEIRFRDALVSRQEGLSRNDILRFVDCLEDARRGINSGFNVKYAFKSMILNMLADAQTEISRKATAHGVNTGDEI
jgi:DNA polymerase III gamma/tau subunit